MRQTAMSTSRARRLRQDMTPAERVLWHALRNRAFLNLKFHRQTPIGPYVADFFCAERRLVVEIDGGGHGGPRGARRDEWMAAQGLRTLRLWNGDVLTNLPGVLERLAEATRP
jgi:very-short-patch-repair endonuclease